MSVYRYRALYRQVSRILSLVLLKAGKISLIRGNVLFVASKIRQYIWDKYVYYDNILSVQRSLFINLNFSLFLICFQKLSYKNK